MGNACAPRQQTSPIAGDPTGKRSFLWYREPIQREESELELYPKQIVGSELNTNVCRTRAQLYHVLEKMPPYEHVMKLESWRDGGSHFRVELEFIKGPSLAHCLSDPEILEPQVARYIMQQLLLGMHHLHLHGVVHCDVKPHNVMLRWPRPMSPSATLAEKFRVVIIDFDDSNVLCEKHGVCVGPGLPTRATSFYLSPEVAKGGRHSISEDIWQLGAVFYRLLTSHHVQSTGFYCFDMLTARRLRNGMEDWDVDYELPVFEKHPDARRICLWMLRMEPNDRPRSCAELLHDPWMTNPAISQYLADNPLREPVLYECLMTEDEERRVRAKSPRASTASGCSPRPEPDTTALQA
ncbi:hypothetical protein Esti_006291 [Eimeria stiedai]